MKYPLQVKIIADSITPGGIRLTTFELVYPRYIHAELKTHRVFSTNSQSSRAVPVLKNIGINEKGVEPITWGKNVAGMSSREDLTGWRLKAAKFIWGTASKMAFRASALLAKVGLHKQWANRLTEPFSVIKTVVSATDWDNFFWLRIDSDSVQPEFVALANLMKQEYDLSIPQELEAEQWHVPYLNSKFEDGKQIFYDKDGEQIHVSTAIEISASCCAQVSFRNFNDSVKKALEIYQKLFSGDKPHMSPTEHQGCVMKYEKYDNSTKLVFNGVGITGVNRNFEYTSGNFRGFIQHRQILDDVERMLKKNKIKEFCTTTESCEV